VTYRGDVTVHDRTPFNPSPLTTRSLPRSASSSLCCQTTCDRCGHGLGIAPPSSPLQCPTRLPSCRHVLCLCCTEATLRHHARCGVCGVPIPPGACKYVDEELGEALRSRGAEAPRECLAAAGAVGVVPLGTTRVVVEVGNTCTTTGARCVQKTFVRVLGPALKAGPIIGSVDFNINPGYVGSECYGHGMGAGVEEQARVGVPRPLSDEPFPAPSRRAHVAAMRSPQPE
jgi:hypothetical protein